MGGHIADLDDGVSAAPPLDGASRPRPQRGRGRQGTNGEESDGGAAGVAAGGTTHDGPGPAPFLFIFMGRMRPSLRRLGVLAKRRHAGHLCWERLGASTHHGAGYMRTLSKRASVFRSPLTISPSRPSRSSSSTYSAI